jgi:integrase
LARTRDPVHDRYIETKIGTANDLSDKTVGGLTFDEAVHRAREIYSEEEARRTSGVQPGSKKRTVDDAIEIYVDGYKSGDARRDEKPGRDLKNLNSILKVHVRPALGHIRLDQLNSGMLEKFKADLAKAPKLSRSGRPANVCGNNDAARPTPPKTNNMNSDADSQEHKAERLRKRRARANRILTPLRAALNYSVVRKLIANDIAWRTALKPYPNVDGATVRYLTLDECERLQRCADEDLRPLVTAAMFTGGRYGSLRLLRVNDLDFNSRTAIFRITKSGKR